MIISTSRFHHPVSSFRPLIVMVFLLLFAAPVHAQATAAKPVRLTSQQLKINLAWQIALDGVHFSPGILDARWGRKSQTALTEYASVHFPGVNPFDKKVFDKLAVDVDHALTTYTITSDDATSVGPLPEDWNEKSKLERLPYDSLIDALAEKFHCTRNLLQTLNPNVNLNTLNVEQTLTVPNLRNLTDSTPPATATTPATRTTTRPQAAYISINLTEKIIRVYDSSSKQLALLHCSVAKDKAKLPARDTAVKVMAANPNYTFDPKHWPEIRNVERVLIIPPGPRNPVGMAWIGLDLPGYGIHGNPKPELIGKTGSHGCFRLTNWDALTLFPMVRVGMPVKIINPEPAGTVSE